MIYGTDNFKRDRDQNLNFFQKLFKKDRIQSAADALEKKELEQISDDDLEINQARRTRLLFYLLILLSVKKLPNVARIVTY